MATQTPPESLRFRQLDTIHRLADRIESIWRTELDLEPYEMPEDLGYVEGTLEGERITIENCCFQTREFRKLHLELAQVGQSLDILHCVMFPRSQFELPMFGADLVGGRGQLGMAIADLSPIARSEQLPTYRTALDQLPELTFSQPRTFPQWGDIFSSDCLFVRPAGAEEEQKIIDRIGDFLTIHCRQSRNMEPVPRDREEGLMAGQKRYCQQQLQNDKTRRVLEKAFGNEWAERYMTQVLFDVL